MLTGSLYNSFTSAATWLQGRKAQEGGFDKRNTSQEKVKTGPSGMLLPWFLPYFNDITKETPVMRQIYRRMLADSNVKAAVLNKILAVAALDMRIIPYNKKNERDKMVANFVEFALMDRIAGAIPGLIWNICSGAVVDGYSICEKVWVFEDKHPTWKYKTVLNKLKPKQVDDDVRLEVDEYWNIRGVRAYRYNGFEVYNPNDFVIFTHLPMYSQPTGMSDLRAAYAKYWLLDTVWKLRAMHLEKRSIPLLMGEYLVNTQRGPLEAALEKAKWSNWISAPQGTRIQAVDIAGRSQSEFQAAVADLREDIFIAITGAVLQSLTGTAGVIRGSSEIHKDTSDLIKWFLAEALKAVLNDYETGLIPDLVDRNFTGAPYPKAVFGGIDDRELTETAQVDNLLHQFLDLSKEEAYEKYGRQPPKNEEDRIISVINLQLEQMGYQQQVQQQQMNMQSQQMQQQEQQQAEQDYMNQLQAANKSQQEQKRGEHFSEALRSVQRARKSGSCKMFVDATKILRNVLKKKGSAA